MVDQEQIRIAARKIVSEIAGTKVTDTEALISSGLIDSLSIVRLMAKLEEALHIAIPPENVQPDDFDSIDFIVDTVLRVTSE